MNKLSKRGQQLFLVLALNLICASFLTCQTLIADEKGITFQEIASDIFGEKIGDDKSGDVYKWGLTARYTGPKEVFPGEGKFKDLFNFLPAIKWFDPAHYYKPKVVVEGEFEGMECVLCHTVQTPGIVKDWKRSRHSQPGKTASMEKEEVVTCNKCHGNDHANLKMPDTNVCGGCHPEKLAQHKSGGPGSHAQAFHLDIVENAWQLDKPAAEMHSCASCHGIAENRCDGCHTRHRFSPAEARRSETCGVCHMGADHYDYETWSNSYHGKIYKSEGDQWNWDLRLKDWGRMEKDGQLPAPRTPTCAFCHMPKGNHNVHYAITVDSRKGKDLVNRGAEKFEAKRKNWIKTCRTCHSPRFAKDQLAAMDEQVNVSFAKVREAFKIVIDLQKEGLLDPMPEGLAPDWLGHKTFSLLPNGKERFYNVSKIEKMALEMMAYHSTAVYKSAAHFSMNDISYNLGAFPMDSTLVEIKSEASKLRRLATLEKKAGINHVPYDFWSQGEYTDLLKGKERKEGDVGPKSECLHEGAQCLDEN